MNFHLGKSVKILYNINVERAGIAQLVEQLSRNQQVAGSSPVSSTIIKITLDFSRVFILLIVIYLVFLFKIFLNYFTV